VSRPASQLLVERALALVPLGDEFLPLSDALIGASHTDREKLWARSAEYSTVGKRVLDADRLAALVPAVVTRAQERMERLFALVIEAVRLQGEGDAAGAARALVRAGEVEEGERRLEQAQQIYSLALEVSRDLRDKDPEILALRRLGRSSRAAGRLEEAWEWYQRSHRLSVAQGDDTGQAIACQGLGNVCDGRGERPEARAWYERGLEIARRLNDPAVEWPFYTNLSVLAMLEGKLPLAERLLDRARERIEASGAEDPLLYWLNNRGLLLVECGEALAAEDVFREALARGPGPDWEVTLRVNLGGALVPQDRLLEAQDEARRAEEIAILNRFVPDLVDVYLLLGSVARAQRDEEGFVFYEQALRVCRERGLPRKTEAAILHDYGVLHARCSRPSEARAYLDAAGEIYRALGFAPELARLAADLEEVGAGD
jgi:tetratricopeptide (TPR) repeat protein